MVAIDTNIIVRFLTQDDTRQYEKAYKIFTSQDVFIADTVIQETEWVLRYAYGFSPDDICTALIKLFGLPNVHLSNPSLTAQAIDWHQQGLDFSDALHLVLCRQHDKFLTFDKKFANKAVGLKGCNVELP